MKAYQKHILRLVEEFKLSLFLAEYCFVVHWECTADNKDADAHVNIDTTYLKIGLHFNGKKMEQYYKRGNSYSLARTVMHELAHAVTQPLYELIPREKDPRAEEFVRILWERQTQRVAVIALNNMNRKVWEIRK